MIGILVVGFPLITLALGWWIGYVTGKRSSDIADSWRKECQRLQLAWREKVMESGFVTEAIWTTEGPHEISWKTRQQVASEYIANSKEKPK